VPAEWIVAQEKRNKKKKTKLKTKRKANGNSPDCVVSGKLLEMRIDYIPVYSSLQRYQIYRPNLVKKV